MLADQAAAIAAERFLISWGVAHTQACGRLSATPTLPSSPTSAVFPDLSRRDAIRLGIARYGKRYRRLSRLVGICAVRYDNRTKMVKAYRALRRLAGRAISLHLIH